MRSLAGLTAPRRTRSIRELTGALTGIDDLPVFGQLAKRSFQLAFRAEQMSLKFIGELLGRYVSLTRQRGNKKHEHNHSKRNAHQPT
jgi:hypothetical protein